MPLFRSPLSITKTPFAKSRNSAKRAQRDVGVNEYGVLEPRQLLASIGWTSGDITGDSDVSTNGTLVFALNATNSNGSSTTVNGVGFVSSSLAGAQSQSQSQSPSTESLTTTIENENANAFETGGLGSVGQIIQSGWWGSGTGNPATATLAGLTVGDTYELQIFANDARSNRDDGFITRLGDGEGGFGVNLELNNQPNGGRAGDFAIGTFTADATTQTFELAGFSDGADSASRIQINAIQLRNLETPDLLPGAVPLINEFSASNAGTIEDDNGNSSDWIEIYNAGEDAVNLAGYSLTDDPTNISKFIFPNTSLSGGEYLVVFAGDDDDPTTGSDLYTGFGLSSSGEYLGFFDDGNLISEFGPNGSDYPAQFTDVSYGLVPDGNFDTQSFFAAPTPGSANASPVDGVIDTLPTVSVERGFYDTAFDVDIASQTPGASLVYTIDGTEPSLTNGTRVDPAGSNSLVEFTLNISETTSLRTAVVRQGFLTRVSTTHTYVFLNDVIASDVLDTAITSQYTNAELRAGLLDIPTLSFNYETVIVDSDQPEQRASIEWLAPDGSEGFQINAGISGFGGNHITSQKFEKENYRVEFRNEYEGRLEFPLFEGFDNGVTATDSFESVEFRGGSHDRAERGFGLSNRFVDDTLLELGHVVPHGRFVHIYVNGVYFGQYHMRERWDADFLAQYYGGAEDDYEAINGNVNNGQSTPNGWDPGDPYDGDGNAWAAVQALADTDGSGNPTGGYQELKEVVNLPQYLDYILLYMAGNTENEYRGGGSVDGSVPYTFFLNDADGWLRSVGDRTGNAGPGNILGTLVDEADPEFMTLYADRIHNLFGEGGVLSAERSAERLQKRIDETQLSFVLESARFSEIHIVSGNEVRESRTPASFFAAANNALENILPAIPVNMINRLRARGLFPSIDAPSFAIEGEFHGGGDIESGDLLTLDANETIYYTLDGTDPRLPGGEINSNAVLFNSGTNTITTTVFGTGSTWRFNDTGDNLGTNWRAASFDDTGTGWSQGGGDFGFGDTPAQTTPIEDNDQITTYFRRTFNYTPGDHDTATFRIKRDDGAVVYLNGVEIFRDNMPAGTITHLTEADDAIPNSAENVFHAFDFDLSLLPLQAGINVFAVEIHQASPTSSDVNFDAEFLVSGQLPGSSSTPIVLNQSTNVQARSFSNGEWSALNNATFAIPVSQGDLRISEIHFNPAAPSAAEMAAGFIDQDDFEFIEIYNPSLTGTINLAGVQLADGVTFAFGNVNLGPGERAVVVEDASAFAARYGSGITVLGQWSGGLSNSGERIDLLDSDANEIMSVNYGDNDPWYVATDGNGFSLVLTDPANTPVDELGKYYRWRASTELGGTPGAASAQPQGVVVNEVLANSDAGQVDTIELFNPTSSAINVGGWLLSDDGENLLKFHIPAGTIISAGGYLVFDETDFNPNPVAPGIGDFALSAAGEQVFLSRITSTVTLSLEDAVEFEATFSGDSLGRLPNGSGQLQRLAQTAFGSANGDHAVSTLIISEVNYHPDNPSATALSIDPLLIDDDLEFIEITNPTGSTISLTNWRLRGESDFDFAAGTTIAAGQSIAVVPFEFDPAAPFNSSKLLAFMSHYGLSSADNLIGGFTGSLSNSFGRVSLQQPDASQLGIPGVVVDEVIYDDLAPWADADGNGLALQRDGSSSNGNFAASWTANAPTPGVSDLNAVIPQVTAVVRDGGSISRPDLWSTFSVQFDADVNVNLNSLSLQNDTDGGTNVDLSGISLSYDDQTFTATWNLDGLTNSLPAAFYTVNLDGSSVTSNSGGLTLDGDGNGTAGGSFTTPVYQAIPGDINLDGTVNVLGDAFALIANLGTDAGASWSQGDINGNGAVNVLGDAFILIANLSSDVLPTSNALFAKTTNQSSSPSQTAFSVETISLAPVLTEPDESNKAVDDSEQNQTEPGEADQLSLAGSVELDEAFASDDWLI